MIVVKGKHCGFCFGVKRAIDTALALDGQNKFVLGEIIHNEKVVSELNNAGVVTIDGLDDIKFNKGDKLIIRTHGEPKSTYERLDQLGVDVVDCTCPFVKDIQKRVNEYYQKGYKIIIIGNANHPEVKGINGWCENSALIIDENFDFRF